MIVAHRGASREAPDNTIPAFQLAWQQGADAIEVDVHLTTDGHIVCTHDRIGPATLADLRAQHAERYADPFKGTTIPTLAEVFSTIPDQKRIYIEIKCGVEIVAPLLEEIRKSGLKSNQVVLISFKQEVLQTLKARAPQYKVYWLCGFKKQKTGEVAPSLETVLSTLNAIKADGLDANAAMPESFIAPLIKQGYEWHVWTVNDVEQAKRMKTLGVQSITTDVPGHKSRHLAAAAGGETHGRRQASGMERR